jgi:nicotinate phosphoribosyltransferase
MIIKSILDTDLYILTMCNATLQLFPDLKVKYKFIDRNKMSFPANFDKYLIEEIKNIEKLYLTLNEEIYLKNNYKYFSIEFIEFLKNYRFDSNELKITLDKDNKLSIEIEGYLCRTIFWEVPLLALITELYYKKTNKIIDINDVNIVNNDLSKIKNMINSNANITDFGTRRRYSFDNQEKIVKLFKNNGNPVFIGTSNVHLAMKYNLNCVGTMAHLWIMFHAVLYGYENANKIALENWQKVYGNDLSIALTDTYTTDVFFKTFDYNLASNFRGLRQDSGSPFKFIDKTIEHYKNLNINPLTKIIIFSDSLTTDLAVEIKKYCENKIQCSFGVGTFLTNSLPKITPTNIVIKISEIFIDNNWRHAVKLSDNITKNTGNIDEIVLCKKILNIL